MLDPVSNTSAIPFAMPGASMLPLAGPLVGLAHDTFSRGQKVASGHASVKKSEGFFHRQWSKLKTIVSDAASVPRLIWTSVTQGHAAVKDATMEHNPFLRHYASKPLTHPGDNMYLQELVAKRIINAP